MRLNKIIEKVVDTQRKNNDNVYIERWFKKRNQNETIEIDWIPSEKSDGTCEVAELEIRETLRLNGLDSIIFKYIEVKDSIGWNFQFTGPYDDLERFITNDYTMQCSVEEYLVK